MYVYGFRVLIAALTALSLAIPATVVLHHAGRLSHLRTLLEYKREKAKTEYAAQHKRWEDAVALRASAEDVAELMKRVETLAKVQQDHESWRRKIETGREPLRKTG